MRPLPPVELVDLRVAPKVQETAPVPWSERLDEGIAGALERGEQAILLLNRRGWASFLQCGDCGEVRRCPRCSVSLTVHQSPAALRCHYCGHSEAVPLTCPACANPLQQTRGVGTQQVERVLAERYPGARIARMDLDSTSTKWSHQRILGAVERGEVDLLVGTQMIAKGLDFPNVTLVGVIDADTGLYLPDFRSAERAFQLLAQVAGRAGRGPRGGRVLVQTRNPRHPALVHAAGHDTEGFLAEELRARQWPAYPPTVALANLVASGLDEQAVARRAAELADWCQALHRAPRARARGARAGALRAREDQGSLAVARDAPRRRPGARPAAALCRPAAPARPRRARDHRPRPELGNPAANSHQTSGTVRRSR